MRFEQLNLQCRSNSVNLTSSQSVGDATGRLLRCSRHADHFEERRGRGRGRWQAIAGTAVWQFKRVDSSFSFLVKARQAPVKNTEMCPFGRHSFYFLMRYKVPHIISFRCSPKLQYGRYRARWLTSRHGSGSAMMMKGLSWMSPSRTFKLLVADLRISGRTPTYLFQLPEASTPL